ncbi:hypothetical protein CRUP_025391 [Coryphaenoides rupestris]|nr:hypothetical protein CRUP_025391 [Coryphaenoides rupestris]
MGSSSSNYAPKTIYLNVDGKVQKVVFSRHCSPCDIKELLCSSSNIPRNTAIMMVDPEGALVSIDPTMPPNSPNSLYKVVPLSTGQLGVEGLKVVEIEKCKNELKKLRDEMNSRVGSRVNCSCKYNFSDDGKKPTPRRDVPNYPKYTLSQETIEALKKPTFDVWHWEHNEMLSCLEYMYHDLGLVKEFNMNPITLKRWLEKLTVTDMGILMTAAVCHDLDHPGYNNTYQINAATELAVRYNDISPLENHHCAVAFQILSLPECNIFANAVITLILATDMARHGEILDSSSRRWTPLWTFSQEEARTCVAEPWVDCLLEEYFMQSDREKSEGLPVAPFMDRDKVTKPTAQIGFIKFVLIPMFQNVMKLFPQIEDIMVQPLRDSRDHYEELKQIDDALTEVHEVETLYSVHGCLSVCLSMFCLCLYVGLSVYLCLS